MKTYQFTAFQNQRYAANGEVKADSPEEAKAKIMQRYNSLWQGLDFDDCVGDEAPDQKNPIAPSHPLPVVKFKEIL